MNLREIYLFFLFLLIAFTKINAQEPAHFILGKEELYGIDIFDIIQDEKNNYWIATDEGLIKYDGYSFQKINPEKALSSSIFDFQIDYNNQLFCKNLSGQIFHIKNDSCQLYFQIPDSLISSSFFYAFDNNNDLIISTNTIFKISKEKKIEYIGDRKNNRRYSGFSTLKDSSLILYNSDEKISITWKNKELKQKEINYNEKNCFIVHFIFNNKLQYYNRNTGSLLDTIENIFFKSSSSPINLIDDRQFKYFYPTNNFLFIAKLSGGIYIFDKNLKSLFNQKLIFKKTFISTAFQDKEGNILLGTFGKGIIVLPNIALKNVRLPDVNAETNSITSNKDYIFIGLQNGRVYTLDSAYNYSTFQNSKDKSVEVLEYLDDANTLLVDGFGNKIICLETGTISFIDFSAIKDVEKIANNNYLISSINGIHIFEITKSPDLSKFNFKKKRVLNSKIVRTNCANFDSLNNTYYTGTSLGLNISNKNNSSYFKLNNSSIKCTDIINHENKIYVATQNNGILIFENEKLIAHWTQDKKLISNEVKQLLTYKNELFLATKIGLQIIDLKGNNHRLFNKTNGLLENNILDFEIKNNAIWFVFQKGIQTIKLNKIKPLLFTPSLSISEVIINDSIVKTRGNNNFPYNENKFEFILSANSTKYKNEIKYQYRIKGIEKKWQINPYEANKITYKILPPGEYIFEACSIFRKRKSKSVNFHFTINPPWWKTWWFYSITIIILITIVFLIYSFQLSRQKKKVQLENELNASKLIAIQSQMNPHFIFNAINSIQDMILKGDIDNSYNYIIKFSKLVRQTLNFSDKEFIDIEDEVELLKIYLELEKLRFKSDFEYQIINNETDIQVPPMLVQPFVENAIKHGLLHKKGLKKLNITFIKNDVLKCIVTDNGIGRKKSKEINERQRKNYNSFSVNATKNRFNIMKTHYQQNLGVEFEDLLQNEEEIGTKVTINMPFKQNY